MTFREDAKPRPSFPGGRMLAICMSNTGSGRMATYSVAEAKNRLPSLLSAAERGKNVTMTRYGKPTVEIRPIGPWRVTAESIDWIEQQLADLPPLGEDAVASLEAMRAEDDH